jgi:hypothetical protein
VTTHDQRLAETPTAAAGGTISSSPSPQACSLPAPPSRTACCTEWAGGLNALPKVRCFCYRRRARWSADPSPVRW